MNLPVILDIVIGLIFVYLTFSLLASEIQSILTTILQWRAVHLKQSIAELISGQTYIDNDNLESDLHIKKVEQLTNSLYKNPLIKDLNYSGSKTGLERIFRKITNRISDLINGLTRVKQIFDGETTAPSQIPSNTFAASLIDTLKIPDLIKTISNYQLEDFINKKLIQINSILNDLDLKDATKNETKANLNHLSQELNIIYNKYKKNDLANINLTLDRILNRLNLFKKKSLQDLPQIAHFKFEEKMILVKQVLTNPHEREALVSEIEPSFSNLLEFWRRWTEMAKVSQVDLQSGKGKIYKKVEETLEQLPESLQNSLYILAKQATTKITTTGDTLNQFQKEVEQWFDNGMERAANVYKRNARGVAFLLGITIAIATNLDTLNLIDHLSKDSLMRATINYYSQELINNSSNSDEMDIENIQNQVNVALDDVKLPIGWGNEVLTDQAVENQSSGYLKWLKRLLGWIISGIAISMGADFWFNLLKKIIEVKNVKK
ncbi:MAG: hypothetical protein O4751_08775 [Trichodesmium sp. St2_bin6]|nr:hypothetical protein [Trichodesmium sp. St4_bin8_1]MDE5073682.1 hypothetical protein [Trichodesmium sp. St5_bin8]MDE5078355.1 hypothetical protein [Trichodesmium sp. St2_bin6]MDE5104153.1 hypothetical protein [Trichodesmium sp. St19_bin2]